jgi:hypothetical protein
MKSAARVFNCIIIVPIWYFLMYTVLTAIHPDRLVWFLFWVYVPLRLIAGLFSIDWSKNS